MIGTVDGIWHEQDHAGKRQCKDDHWAGLLLICVLDYPVYLYVSKKQ